MPKFKVGDKVKSIINPIYAYEIIIVDLVNYLYHMLPIAFIDPTSDSLPVYIFTGQTSSIDKSYELVSSPTINIDVRKTQAILDGVKPCTCSNRDLFNKGCTCGAVKPFKLKMS